MIKRFFDLVLSIFLIILFAPILLLVAILIRMNISSSIFFIQKRPGLKCKPFYLIKFKSMYDINKKMVNSIKDHKRISKLGDFLRRTSIDELPTLINIIKGDMSFIGPRPLLMEYLKYYDKNEIRRHDVKPGLSGWAQINGRNLISWEEKFKLDLWYVDNNSILLDLKILIITIWKVIKSEGIYTNKNRIMPKFQRKI